MSTIYRLPNAMDDTRHDKTPNTTTVFLDSSHESSEAEMSDTERGNELLDDFGSLQLNHERRSLHRDVETMPNFRTHMHQPRPLSFSLRSSSQQRPSTPPKSLASPFSVPPTITKTPPRSEPSGAPLMQRSYSSASCPSPTLLPTIPRSSSPMRSPKRVRSPFRHSVDEAFFGGSATTLSPEISSISEDAELEITPRNYPVPSFPATAPPTSPYSSMTFPRPLRRRPASPLRSLSNSRAQSVPASPKLSASSMPSIPTLGSGRSEKFNEGFPTDLPYYTSPRSFSLSASPMPSTPTSTRSRSPSISSLETIPDTPDAEVLAAEEDRKDREDRKKMWDLYGGQGSTTTPIPRSGFGNKDKRKRWSVCGAEKRSDLNLETIWED